MSRSRRALDVESMTAVLSSIVSPVVSPPDVVAGPTVPQRYANFSSTTSSNATMNTGRTLDIGFDVLSAFLFFLFILAAGFLLAFPGHYWRRRRRRQLAAARLRASTAVAVAGRISEPQPQQRCSPSQRYAIIETWLVSKSVAAHDAICDEGQRTAVSLNTSSLNKFPADSSQNECSICYEEFVTADIVSWSPNPGECNHIYHHGCIKEWLLKHDSCPCCRQTFLPIDDACSSLMQIQKLLWAQQIRSEPAFYCVEHGVVRPTLQANRDRCSFQLCDRSNQQYSLAELQHLRGSNVLGRRPTKSCVDDECVTDVERGAEEWNASLTDPVLSNDQNPTSAAAAVAAAAATCADGNEESAEIDAITATGTEWTPSTNNDEEIQDHSEENDIALTNVGADTGVDEDRALAA